MTCSCLQIAEVVERIDVLHSIVTAPAMRPFVFLIKKIFSTFLLSYALVSFSLLIWSSWLTVSTAMYLCVQVVCGGPGHEYVHTFKVTCGYLECFLKTEFKFLLIFFSVKFLFPKIELVGHM